MDHNCSLHTLHTQVWASPYLATPMPHCVAKIALLIPYSIPLICHLPPPLEGCTLDILSPLRVETT